jgi:hypothetical protein
MGSKPTKSQWTGATHNSISPFAIANKGYLWPTRHSNPVPLALVKVAVEVYKKYRKIARASEIMNTTFNQTKRLLQAYEPTIFQTHPIRKGGQPAFLRTSLTKEELEFAKKFYKKMTIQGMARKFSMWTVRFSYLLWKAGIHKPGTRFAPMKGAAPDNWPKSWQREYIETEMKKRNSQFEAVADDLFPKSIIGGDDLDEINELLKEYGIE